MRAAAMKCSALAVAGALFAAPAMAAGIELDGDGWYRWEVAAGPGGQRSCCYRFRGAEPAQVGCNLGNGTRTFTMTDHCDMHSDAMALYVEVRSGKVREIHALSSACPVDTGSAVAELENVTTGDSIDWLMGQASGNRKLLDEAIMAISFHAEGPALDALSAIVEDSGIDQEAREQALFWLVQSDSDAAYAYLDALLR